MSFNLSLIVFGLLLVTITIGIQSAPVETIKESKLFFLIFRIINFILLYLVFPSSKNTLIESIDSVKPAIDTSKKKRNIDEYDQFEDDSVEDFPKENEDTLQKQTSARIVRSKFNHSS
jgi:hypothetical protein